MFEYALIIGILATIVFLVLRIKKAGFAGAFAKTGASLMFVCTGLAAVFDSLPDRNSLAVITFNRWSLFIIIGLVCGLIGDLLLDLKFVHLDSNEFYTFGGFAFFLAGHLCYTIAVYNTLEFSLAFVLAAIAIAGIFALFVVFGEKKLKVKFGKYKAISAVYVAVMVYFTVISAGAMFKSSFAKGPMFLALGGLLFLISDLILSGTYFGQGKNRKKDIILNHVFYYAAQFLIASSILFI